MSSISEESETGDDEEMIEHQNSQEEEQQKKLNVENCLGDLNNFKEVKILFSI